MKREEASHNPSGVTVRSQPTLQASKARATSVKHTKHGIHCMLNVNMQQKRVVSNLKTKLLEFYSELIPKNPGKQLAYIVLG